MTRRARQLIAKPGGRAVLEECASKALTGVLVSDPDSPRWFELRFWCPAVALFSICEASRRTSTMRDGLTFYSRVASRRLAHVRKPAPASASAR
jgi:hypothetical protein